MKDGKRDMGGEAPGRRAASAGRRGARPAKPRGSMERAAARASPSGGHSGYGSESVRPYLREQLRLKALLPTPFPTPDTQPGKDEHRQ